MKRKTLLITLLLACLTSIPPGVKARASDIDSRRAARTAAAEQEAGAVSYTIIRRDTLWDISDRFLQNPFKWPSIWKINPYIKNPDLIYPGDVVKIPPYAPEAEKAPGVDISTLPVVKLDQGEGKVVVLEPEVQVEEKPARAPERPKFHSGAIAKKGFVSDDGLKGSGLIIKAKENTILISEGDRVYLSFRDKSKVFTGERYTVFKEGPRVRHPVTHKKLGYMIDVLGSLVINETVGVVEGRIDRSYKEIETGARLMPYREPASEVAITKAGHDVNGYIITSLEGSADLAKGDIVYIDRGTGHGLQNGNLLNIYRLVPQTRDPLTKKKVDLPPSNIGTLVVIEAGEATSSCIIIKSLEAIATGDFVSTIAGE